MLVLSRDLGQRIIVGDGLVVITVVEIRRGVVRLGIEAPKGLTVDREEIHERRQRNQQNGGPV
jgi:carbon storage regulator